METAADADDVHASAVRQFNSPHTITPCTNLLSNGRYAVMITNAGSGYSRWGDIAVTRWREDVTRDDWGAYVFLRDMRDGQVWSAGFQPAGVEPDHYEVNFSEGQAEIIRRDGTITTRSRITVSSEADAEVRRVSISNSGGGTRDIELTSYAELVLAPHAADDAHPAFSKLFVETEFVAETGAILATRRRQAKSAPEVWVAHLAVVEGETIAGTQYETDRARFLGRGRSIRNPIAMAGGASLSNSVGAVLDPIFSLRRRIRVPPRTTVHVAFWTMAAASRDEVLDLVDKHHGTMAFDRVATLAWTQAQVELRHLGIAASEANVFQDLAGRVLYADPSSRPASEVLKHGGGPASLLWAEGISGDRPIVLLRLAETSELEIVRELLLAHEYWRMKQLSVDLVIINERPPSLRPGSPGCSGSAGPSRADRGLNRPETMRTARFTSCVPTSSRPRCGILLRTVARATLAGHRGTLSEQVGRVPDPSPSPRLVKRGAAGAVVARRAASAGDGVLQRSGRFRR